ncbi:MULTISPECIES: hypothetical protein [Maribacter]|uniref:DUF3108 domain-containing protein n=1 Tax=Maribacter flavus TaxID=1658664 RepID=A0A5B2U1H5_9FLAO|nr:MULTISPECIES: hypothetical protein [Maribacter]KAA2219950.1 hypothetical protein F0361_10295 [Maribacter flavus]MDC6405151.1 hypothetical protein [Maribacter sp. PR66]MEE1972042.1 hypothetical protein [Maribacter flavus]
MKIKFLFCLTFLYGTSLTLGQNACSKYYPMEEGSTFQYTMYDKKDKVEGVTDYVVSNVENDGGNTTATMKLTYTDDKGKNVLESDYNITCTGNGVKIDYESLFPSEMKKQYEDMGMDMEITGTDIEIPNDLSAGQTLDDANLSVTMDMGAMKMKINVDTFDRKVEKMESVTTPAGTFDCYLITEKSKSKVMMANVEMSNKVWISEGVGMIKQESYGKNGKLMSRMELTKYSK